MDRDWGAEIEQILDKPCVHCNDDKSKVAMPVTQPKYVEPYLEEIAGPDEPHEVSSDGHCINPKCRAPFDDSMVSPDGSVQCPTCGTKQQTNPVPFSAGGMTRAGLSLKQMGDIGEQVVLRMGDLPGVGAVHPASDDYNHAIDAIITGQRGNYGAEIKTNHSQAQQRFKVGGKGERAEKIAYCYQHGLKPALIGVRLNFYTDKAYIFFREGLTDTWIGNQQMIHVATVDFADLNPFKSPDPQARAMEIENAHIPDQSTEEDFGFGFESKTAGDDFEGEHPRNKKGEFVVKDGTRRVKVVHPKTQKHTHDAIWCVHCGERLFLPKDRKGRTQCSSCGEDPERILKQTKVVVAGNDAVYDIAKQYGFQFAGYNGNGHRRFVMDAPNGTRHTVVAGSGAHGSDAQRIDADRARQRMTRCFNGQCDHGQSETLPQNVAPREHFALVPGQRIVVNDHEYYITDVDGSLAVVLDPSTGVEEIAPIQQIQQEIERLFQPQQNVARTAGEKNPDFLFVYYHGKLRCEDWHHNKRFQDIFARLLEESGQTPEQVMMDIDAAEVAAGEIFEFEDGSIRVDHKQLAHEEARERADDALLKWFEEKEDVLGEGDVQPRDPETGEFISDEEAGAWGGG